MIPGSRTGDLVVTWPKSRPLSSYLSELAQAERHGLDINYRVAQRPTIASAPRVRASRCYMVHDGYVRGHNEVREVVWRALGEVAVVLSDQRPGAWPEGWYIVRDPRWHQLDEPVELAGFRGFRYAS